jgi:hypothetical protein
MTKIVTATLTKDQWVRAYLTLWQGMLNLTDKELEIAVTLIRHFLLIRTRVSDDETASYLMLSRGTRRKIKLEHNLSAAGLGNYLIAFTKKGLLTKDDGVYKVVDKLIPQESITFNFTIK